MERSRSSVDEEPENKSEVVEEPLNSNNVLATSSPSYESDIDELLREEIKWKKEVVLEKERLDISQVQLRIFLLECKFAEVQNIDYEKEKKKAKESLEDEIPVFCKTEQELEEFMQDREFAIKMECSKREKEISKATEELLAKKWEFKERFAPFQSQVVLMKKTSTADDGNSEIKKAVVEEALNSEIVPSTNFSSNDSVTKEQLEKQKQDEEIRKLEVLKFERLNNARLIVENATLGWKYDGADLFKYKKEIEEEKEKLEVLMKDEKFALEVEIIQKEGKIFERQKELIEYELKNHEVIDPWRIHCPRFEGKTKNEYFLIL